MFGYIAVAATTATVSALALAARRKYIPNSQPESDLPTHQKPQRQDRYKSSAAAAVNLPNAGQSLLRKVVAAIKKFVKPFVTPERRRRSGNDPNHRNVRTATPGSGSSQPVYNEKQVPQKRREEMTQREVPTDGSGNQPKSLEEQWRTTLSTQGTFSEPEPGKIPAGEPSVKQRQVDPETSTLQAQQKASFLPPALPQQVSTGPVKVPASPGVGTVYNSDASRSSSSQSKTKFPPPPPPPVFPDEAPFSPSGRRRAFAPVLSPSSAKSSQGSGNPFAPEGSFSPRSVIPTMTSGLNPYADSDLALQKNKKAAMTELEKLINKQTQEDQEIDPEKALAESMKPLNEQEKPILESINETDGNTGLLSVFKKQLKEIQKEKQAVTEQYNFAKSKIESNTALKPESTKEQRMATLKRSPQSGTNTCSIRAFMLSNPDYYSKINVTEGYENNQYGFQVKFPGHETPITITGAELLAHMAGRKQNSNNPEDDFRPEIIEAAFLKDRAQVAKNALLAVLENQIKEVQQVASQEELTKLLSQQKKRRQFPLEGVGLQDNGTIVPQKDRLANFSTVIKTITPEQASLDGKKIEILSNGQEKRVIEDTKSLLKSNSVDNPSDSDIQAFISENSILSDSFKTTPENKKEKFQNYLNALSKNPGQRSRTFLVAHQGGHYYAIDVEASVANKSQIALVDPFRPEQTELVNPEAFHQNFSVEGVELPK